MGRFSLFRFYEQGHESFVHIILIYTYCIFKLKIN